MTLLAGNGDTVDAHSNRFAYEMHPHRHGWLFFVILRLKLWMILREVGNGRRSQRWLPVGRNLVRSSVKVFEGKVFDAVVTPVEVENHLPLNPIKHY